MTRVLDFTGARGQKRFQLLWAALMAGGDGKGERGREVIRKEARLQDAFEAISDGLPVNGNGDAAPLMRTLKVDPETLAITQEDFDLLQQYAEKTPWTPQVSRDVVDLWDWMSAADRQD